MSLLGLSLFTGGAPAPSPNINAAPSIMAVTLEFDISGNAAPTIAAVPLNFDVVVSGS